MPSSMPLHSFLICWWNQFIILSGNVFLTQTLMNTMEDVEISDNECGSVHASKIATLAYKCRIPEGGVFIKGLLILTDYSVKDLGTQRPPWSSIQGQVVYQAADGPIIKSFSWCSIIRYNKIIKKTKLLVISLNVHRAGRFAMWKVQRALGGNFWITHQALAQHRICM